MQLILDIFSVVGRFLLSSLEYINFFALFEGVFQRGNSQDKEDESDR